MLCHPGNNCIYNFSWEGQFDKALLVVRGLTSLVVRGLSTEMASQLLVSIVSGVAALLSDDGIHLFINSHGAHQKKCKLMPIN